MFTVIKFLHYSSHIVFHCKCLYLVTVDKSQYKPCVKSPLLRRNVISFLLLCTIASAQSLKKAADDDATKYTTIGSIGLTITNFGTIGNQFTTWPNQPSCEYPKGSGIENIWQGALWVGGIPRKRGFASVSTGAMEQTPTLHEGYEMTNEPGATILQRSTLSTSSYFDIGAISHQDFVMDFTDRNTHIPQSGDTIPRHTPLGVDIHLESYAWNFPFADFFVILNYTIKNKSNDTIDGVYVGIWHEPVVRNTKVTGNPRSAPGFYGRTAIGYVDSLRMTYAFDINSSDNPSSNNYIAIKLLGTTPFPLKRDSLGNFTTELLDSLGDLAKNTYFNGWRFSGSGSGSYLFYPDIDLSGELYRGKYQRLANATPLTKGQIETLGRLSTQPNSEGLTNVAGTFGLCCLLSVGPFKSLAPGESIQVVYAVIAAKKFGNDIMANDYKNPTLRKTLYSNATWAQQAYNGEDVNGNNKLDPGEDIVNIGILDRFILPQPPRQPKVRAVVENQRVTLYWDKNEAEGSVDPISHKKDFEGYRIYRSSAGVDIKNPENFLLSMQLVGDFDRDDDSIGYNTGFGRIKLDTPKKFDGDTTEYWYQFPPKNDPITSLNGWQYLYGVSSYDQGDSNVASLESAKVIKLVVPGTPPSLKPSDEIGVYPNPYYVNAAWDFGTERTRKIYFTNLPPRAQIKIFTLSGDLVAELHHDAATYNGSGIHWFDNFTTLGVSPQMSGGEHAWDLITRYDQAIATGLYLFTVKNLDTGEIKRGKFVIVK